MLNDTRDSAQETLARSEEQRTDPRREKTRDARARPREPHSPALHGLAVDGCRADVLAALCTAVLCPERQEGERQLQALLDAGADPAHLIDNEIPEAARTFGAAWSDGGHSFAEVTIAVARLQGWLRNLDRHSRGHSGRRDPFRLDAPEILLVVPEGSQHTLGAMVAMSRLRRLGALVRLSLGQDARTLGRVVRSGHFDMVALSAAGNEGLDFLAKLINSIRSGIGPSPLVVLGGEILNQYRDAPALVGADFGTSDPEEALFLCGLTTSAEAGASVRRPNSTMRGSPERVSTGI